LAQPTVLPWVKLRAQLTVPQWVHQSVRTTEPLWVWQSVWQLVLRKEMLLVTPSVSL
jgi:hypothetical protein